MNVAGINFREDVAPLVEELLAAARALAGPDCVYATEIDLRAAIHPDSADKNGMGVFLRVVPREYGAQVVLNKVVKNKRPARRLTAATLEAILADIPLWFDETAEIIGSRTGATRNQRWTRDELILALEQYFKTPPWTISRKHPAIVALSEELNQLAAYKDAPDKARYRNANGVYMKLMNLQFLDPARGGKGLDGGGKLVEPEIWAEYATDHEKLRQAAQTIRQAISTQSSTPELFAPESEVGTEFEFAEGKVVTAVHQRRERNPQLRKALLASRHATDSMRCDLCGWRPPTIDGYEDAALEGHHVLPLAMAVLPQRTRVQDMALLCANCHRLTHRAISKQKRWLTLSDLQFVLLP